MSMNSIYIESDKILARKDIVEWLDGCGVKTGSGRNLSQMLKEMTNLKDYAVAFILPDREFMRSPLAYYNAEGYTHCQTPEQFCGLIAESLGIGKPVFNEVNDQNDHTESHMKPSYPHKTYRILDSLDGIPLDKRFKLSEFPLPPFGKEVLFVIKGKFFRACVSEIKQNVIVLGGADRGFANDYLEHKDLDGHWMRIV